MDRQKIQIGNIPKPKINNKTLRHFQYCILNCNTIDRYHRRKPLQPLNSFRFTHRLVSFDQEFIVLKNPPYIYIYILIHSRIRNLAYNITIEKPQLVGRVLTTVAFTTG